MTQWEITYRVAQSGLHPDDAREVIRIFACLTEARQKAILDTWPTISARIQHHRNILEEERLIMIADPLDALIEGYEALITRAKSYSENFTTDLLQTNI
jgi:hypothetical protein